MMQVEEAKMSLIPAFELGVWNAWLLMIWFVLPPILLNLTSKGRASFKRLTGSVPVKHEKLLNVTSTTAGVVGALYSIFLPLKLGTIWLYIGLGVFIIGLIIYLGVMFAVRTSPLDKPITKGSYRYSRHPAYLAESLIFLSITIACVSWVFLLITIIIRFHEMLAAPVEERLCIEKFGDTYREYMKRTPRWIGIPKSSKK